MPSTTHRRPHRSLPALVGLCILACTSAVAAQEEHKLDRVDRELQQLLKREKTMVPVPVGTIMAWAGNLDDTNAVATLRRQGWLPCDGAEQAATEFKDLYEVIGTAYGGDKDARRFNLPDLRGRFLRGTDRGAGNDPDALARVASAAGGNSGDQVGSKQEDALASHKHSVHAEHAGVTARGTSSGDPLALAGFPKYGATKEVDATGGKETRPRNVSVNWIIKARSVLPTAP